MSIHIVECPRDAMQGWPHFIETGKKIEYLNSLLQVGFDTLDFGSFVSPKAIPQMRDTAEVLKGLDQASTTKLLAIVANERGAEEASRYDSISSLGFPFSISPTFQQRNTNSTMEESLVRLENIQSLCRQQNKELVVYLSMGFGNPYGDPYHADILLQWAGEMIDRGIGVISLADTVGLASAQQVREALEVLVPQHPGVTFGVHLHSTAQNWREKLDAAIKAGATRVDGALKGIGGCPMAQDDLVGNMNTEYILGYLEENHLSPVINKEALARSLRMAESIFM